MFKCDIVTDAGVYSVTLEPTTKEQGDEILTNINAWGYVKRQLADNAPLIGDDGLFSIEPGASVKAIIVKEIVAVLQQDIDASIKAPAPTSQEGFYKFEALTHYTGQPICIEGTAHTDKAGFTHYLPTTINRMPAIDLLSEKHLCEVMITWKLENDPNSAGSFLVVAPIGSIDIDEEVEYLNDYIKETRKPAPAHGDGSAKAWNGWKDGGKI